MGVQFVRLFIFLTILLTILPFITAFALIASPASSTPDQEPGTIPIIAMEWQVTLNTEQSGFYNQIFNNLMSDMGMTGSLTILPYKRAIRTFLLLEEVCLFLHNKELLELEQSNFTLDRDKQAIIASKGIIQIRIGLFSQYGKLPLTQKSDLTGKTIGHPNGSPAPSIIDHPGVTYITASNEQNKIQLLLSKRVDYITGTLPDLVFQLRALGIDELPPLSILNDFEPSYELGFLCKETKQGKAIITATDKTITKFRENGYFQELFRAYGLDPASYIPN